MKDVSCKKISIRSVNTGINIQDNFYIQVNKKYIHLQNVTPSRVLQIMNNAINGNIDFCCKNFTIRKNKRTVKCMFCQRRKNNFFIYGNSEEKRNLCVCEEHLNYLYENLIDIFHHGNCVITPNSK